jgi:hypothetical protein
MKERQIEELLAQVVLPPPPDSLRQRVMDRARDARSRGVLALRLTWYRALEAAATIAILAGAAGPAR